MSTEWIIFLVFFHFSWSGILAENITMDACEPKQCGNLMIVYPFWINGQQPDYCGYPSFKIDCAHGKPVLAESYHLDYYIGEIFYENNSAVLINSVFANNKDYCSMNDLNISTSLSQFKFIYDLNVSVSLSQFVISPSPLNKELIFFSNCSKPLKPPYYSLFWNCTNQWYIFSDTFVRLYSNYSNETQDLPDDVPSDCNISRVPVLGTNNLTAENDGRFTVDGSLVRVTNGFLVQRMMAEGFLVQWMVADCSLCKESNGRCGFSRTVSTFMCICSNGTGSDGTMYPTSCPVSENGQINCSNSLPKLDKP
ncbi:hypothetical protein LUZ60_014198 [Juncus effusus]|nr:hypothetical protein LUZ60_014198 [Juncus effusus]